MTLEERFWAKVERSDGCWEWTGAKTRGYGVITTTGSRLAHRIAYELLVGPIPTGLTLDHLCRNKACVNPAHLEPVPHRTNNLRGTSNAARNARATHCVHGHPFDEANTYWTKGGTRQCRACHRRREAEYHVYATPEQLRRAHQISAAAKWAKWRQERGIPG